MYKKACKIVLFIKPVAFLGRTIRKVMRGGGGGGEEYSSRRNFFRYHIPCMNFFSAITWIFFRVNLACINLFFCFFLFISFSLARCFCLYVAPPPPPLRSFLIVRPFDVRVAVAAIGSSTIRHHRVQSWWTAKKKRFVRLVNSQVCVLYSLICSCGKVTDQIS